MALLLRAVDVADRFHWRWLLTDEASGAALADHQVALDPAAPELDALTDLYGYVRWGVADEAAAVDRFGEWLAAAVLGKSVGAAIVARTPVTVRVRVPQALSILLLAPLELSHVDGQPLAQRGDVSVVYDVVPDGLVSAETPLAAPVGDRLRMVAVFSLPTDARPLALRRERYALTRLVHRLAARNRRAIDLEILQYGVTRAQVAARLTAGGGPDVLHLSGHGGIGALALELADGSTDVVSTEDLLAMLRPARQRLKLVVASACLSATGTVAETLAWLGLDEAAQAAQEQADAEAREARQSPLSGLAGRLALELGCAVWAMRYPVYDEFAIALADRLYEGLFALDLPVDAAVRRAVPAAAGPARSVSLGTPALLGASAAGLSLAPPRGTFETDLRMEGFPEEPERFVGRARAMAVAGAALAPESGHTGVLLHGMAGAGKTSCAVELAYRHRQAFTDLVFWKAPTDSEQWAGALVSLATTLDNKLREHGLEIVDKLAPAERWRAFLPRLTEFFEQFGLLLVLDNLETLLTPVGAWRDPQWGELAGAMTGHRGQSRVVFTSRVVPAGLDLARVLVEPVHALSRDEAALLARELPHLRTLLHTEPGPVRDAQVQADRDQVHRVLRIVQGHPKLLELADAAASNPATLAAHLDAAEAAAHGHGPKLSAFFTTGQSTLDPAGFLDVLAGWTTAAMATLPEPSRLLLQVLCATEEGDRESRVLDANWADIWRRLGRAGDPPPLAPAGAALTGAALLHAEGTGPVHYHVHPGVAEVVAAGTAPAVAEAVDTELGAFWAAVSEDARRGVGGERGGLVVRAGLAGAPYLMRRGQWDTANFLLQEALVRDGTAGVVQAALPHLRRTAAVTGAANHLGVLAEALWSVDPAEALRLLADAHTRAETAGDHRIASTAAGALVEKLAVVGRLREALDWAERAAGHTRAAGLGAWAHLVGDGRRLRILHRLGEPARVLADLVGLRERMAALPERADDTDGVHTWNVRETILATGAAAARDLGRWQQALDINGEVTASRQGRGAGPHMIARTRFDNYGPLLALGRLDEADKLLRACQQSFEDQADLPALAGTLGARAVLEDRRGRPGEAVALQRAALRLTYTRPDPRVVAVSHYNLANYLAATSADPATRLAHRLAATLLRHLTGDLHNLANNIRAFAADVRDTGTTNPPATLAEVAALVERVDGVHFTALVTTLAPDLGAADQALAWIIAKARETGSTGA